MLYRIHTEDKNKQDVLDMVAEVFDGFTVIEATGYWKGKREKSLIIEIDTPADRARDVLGLAARIRDYNAQEAVLVRGIMCFERLV